MESSTTYAYFCTADLPEEYLTKTSLFIPFSVKKCATKLMWSSLCIQSCIELTLSFSSDYLLFYIHVLKWCLSLISIFKDLISWKWCCHLLLRHLWYWLFENFECKINQLKEYCYSRNTDFYFNAKILKCGGSNLSCRNSYLF